MIANTHMVSIKEWYRRVNSTLPPGSKPPTEKEAINAVRRLYRFVTKNKWRGKIQVTSGRRYTWPRGTTYFVNPNRSGIRGGWSALLHDLSHYLHWYRYGNRLRPHCREHARLELKLRKEAVRRGWIKHPEQSTIVPAMQSQPT
jgi:hypothetical protein